MQYGEKERIVDLLKERNVLLTMRKHFNFHFINGKYYILSILMSIGFFTLFFNSALFENFSDYHMAICLLIAFASFICCFVLFFSMCMLFDEDFKIVFNNDRYINSKLSKKEVIHLKAIVPDEKKNKMDSYKFFINKKRQKIDNEFKKKEKLEVLYDVLRKDPELFEEYKSYFENKLKDYNKLQKSKKENNENLNKELKEAGMELIENNSECLSLKISEE
jgi:hypothetical protein